MKKREMKMFVYGRGQFTEGGLGRESELTILVNLVTGARNAVDSSQLPIHGATAPTFALP